MVFSIKCLRNGKMAELLERLTNICFEAEAEAEEAGGLRRPTTLLPGRPIADGIFGKDRLLTAP